MRHTWPTHSARTAIPSVSSLRQGRTWAFSPRRAQRSLWPGVRQVGQPVRGQHSPGSRGPHPQVLANGAGPGHICLGPDAIPTGLAFDLRATCMWPTGASPISAGSRRRGRTWAFSPQRESRSRAVGLRQVGKRLCGQLGRSAQHGSRVLAGGAGPGGLRLGGPGFSPGSSHLTRLEICT